MRKAADTSAAIKGPFAPVILGANQVCDDCQQSSSRRLKTQPGFGPTWSHCKTCWAPLPGINPNRKASITRTEEDDLDEGDDDVTGSEDFE